METMKATTPVTQVARRRPRQAAMKNFAHRWMTMKKKKSSVDQRWSEFTNNPARETCHHAGPSMAMTAPDKRTTRKAARVRAPKM